MSNSQHGLDKRKMTQNQNNQMSDDPGDGSRNSFTAGEADGGENPAEKTPPQDRQDQETLSEFGKKG